MNLRPYVLALAVAGLLSGCGSSSDTVNPEVSLDTTPPSAPGPVASRFDARLQRNSIVWGPSSSADVESYQIYTFNPHPMRESAYQLYATTDSDVTTLDVPYVPVRTSMHVRIRAIDAAGNPGPYGAITEVTLQPSRFDVP